MSSKSLRNGIFSFIIPGLGHALDGNVEKAVPLFLIAIILHILIYFVLNNPLGSVVNTLYHVYAGLDAYDENSISYIKSYIFDMFNSN